MVEPGDELKSQDLPTTDPVEAEYSNSDRLEMEEKKR